MLEFPIESLDSFEYREDKPVTKFVEQINEAVDTNIYQKFSYRWITQWLKKNEYLKEEFHEELIIDDIQKQRNLEEKWIKCVDLALTHIGDCKEKGIIANKSQSLKRILNKYIITPSQIRNKIAHGQWAECLNNDCSDLNHHITGEIKKLDFVKLDRLFTVYDMYQQCIVDLIVSPKTHYRDFYSLMVRIEEYIRYTKDWDIETKREQLADSSKMITYKQCRNLKK